MPDTKITALTALTTADPANDMMPIVDVSDTTMAASGTTKRISINNILACSPSATLASATITGDLTVDTNTLFVDAANNRVGIGTITPLNAGHIQGAGQATVTPTVTGDGSALSLIDSQTLANNGGMLVLGSTAANGNFGQVAIKSLLTNGLQNGTSALAFFTRAAVGDTTLAERYRIAQDGVATWSNISGVAGTAMTLNNIGLGLGGLPNTYVNYKTLAVVGGSAGGVIDLNPSGGVTAGGCQIGGTATTTTVSAVGPNAGAAASLVLQTGTFGSLLPRVTIDGLGNTISNVNSAIPSLGTNSQMVFNLTTNTNLRISVRGTDGTTRVANITLA
jgi:hypothetical protein